MFKVKRNERDKFPTYKTVSELKKLKLMPSKDAVAYTYQQYTGEICYLYDINDTKEYKISKERREELRQYRKELKERKRCECCHKIVKKLCDLEYNILLSKKVCKKCQDAILEQKLQEARDIRHDFTSKYIERGLDLSCNKPLRNYERIYLDFETTGLSKNDEVLQTAIISEDGEILLYKLSKPTEKKQWDEAMKINGITPADVANAEPFDDKVVQDIIDHTVEIVCYNISLENLMLDKYNIKNFKSKLVDCMELFAPIYGQWNDFYQSYAYKSLEEAARYVGYEFEPHNSLEDVFATKMVYEYIINLKKTNRMCSK